MNNYIGGYNCAYCGMWIGADQTHSCQPTPPMSSPTPITYTWPPDLTRLDRIIELLEKILKKVK